MHKLQFLVIIFAVLLSKLCNVSLCNYKYIKAVFRFARWRRSAIQDCWKLKIWILRQALGPTCITVPNLIKIGQMVAEMWWFNGFQNGSCPPSWIFEIQFLTFWEAKRPILLHHTKFCKDQSNRCGDIAIFVIFEMAAAAMLDYQKFKTFTVDPLYGANMCLCATFHRNRSHGIRAYDPP